VVFSLRVQLNFELEREILGFGNRLKVLGPERLKRRIKQNLEEALEAYQLEMSESALSGAIQKLNKRGYATLHNIFNRKELNTIKNKLHQYFKKSELGNNVHAVRNILQHIPDLKPLLMNKRLVHILKKLNSNLFLTKAIFFDKTPEANWYVTWHQDIVIQVAEKIETEGFSGWTRKHDAQGVCPPDDVLRDTVTIRIHLDDATAANGALNVIPGSHNKKLGNDEIHLITESCAPTLCEVRAGGIHIMKPLLLHASSKTTNQKPRKVLHLEFNSLELPNGLAWAERLPVT
jgi:ectoine hydroxylase-related dioxygenase (phytanoyl-CoA dioxygenase family)